MKVLLGLKITKYRFFANSEDNDIFIIGCLA